MAPKGGRGGGGGGSSYGGGSSNACSQNGAFQDPLSIAYITINAIAMFILIVALYTWSKARKLYPLTKSLLSWYGYGFAIIVVTISEILTIISSIMIECRTRGYSNSPLGIVSSILWYFGMLILLAVIMLTIHKFVLNALGKRTMLFTILHGGILGLLTLLLAGGQGAMGYNYQTGTLRMVTFNLAVAYHILVFLVTIYLGAIFAFWTHKLRASRKVKIWIGLTIFCLFVFEIGEIAYRFYARDRLDSYTLGGTIVFVILGSIPPVAAFVTLILAAAALVESVRPTGVRDAAAPSSVEAQPYYAGGVSDKNGVNTAYQPSQGYQSPQTYQPPQTWQQPQQRYDQPQGYTQPPVYPPPQGPPPQGYPQPQGYHHPQGPYAPPH